MHVLAFVNSTEPALGTFGERLTELGAKITVIERDSATPIPRSVDGIDLVLHMGSSWHVDGGGHDARIQEEIDLSLAMEAADRPVIGVCFGAQLIAKAHGGSVRRMSQPEVGYHRMSTTDDGDLAPEGPWFQFHMDAFTEPQDASVIARTDLAPQVVRRGRTLGWQFHPEITPEIVADWLALYPDMLEGTALDAQQILAAVAADAPATRQRARDLLDAALREVGAL